MPSTLPHTPRLQLDRVPPRSNPPHATPNPGTILPISGVEIIGLPAGAGVWLRRVERPRRPPRWREWTAVSLVCLSLLGQGESYRADPRFLTPGATIGAYWEALRANDVDRVAECFADPSEAVPRPGMVWFLPPTQKLTVQSVHYGPGESGRVAATYEVRFLPLGSVQEMGFVTRSELVRVRGEWRLVGVGTDAAWPDWKPTPRPVDI